MKTVDLSSWPADKIYLNLGCGHHAPESWINIDRSPQMLLRKFPKVKSALRRANVLTEHHMGEWPDNVVRRDLTEPLPLPDGVASAVYSSHMLEHLFLEDARRFLGECARVTRPGAVLRLALPDAEQFARDMLEAGEDPDGKAGLQYQEMLRAHPEERPSGKRLVTFVGGSNYHRWQPVRGLVKSMLRDAGFTDVQERTFRDGALPEVEIVELREDSWFVEGVRA